MPRVLAVLIWKSKRYTSAMSEQTCEPLQPPGIDEPMSSDLLDPYEKLVTIEILGKQVDVPEKNRLLRCFQFLSLRTISYGDFCWNGDCTNCQVWFHTGEPPTETDKPALSCRLEVIEGMKITSMSPYLKIEGITNNGGIGEKGKGEKG
jgi:hypothetical protein